MKTTNSNASIAVHSPALPMPVFPGGAMMGALQKPGGLLSRAWNWIRERGVVRSCSRRLHVAATASLGEKRFVAVVQMDGLEFLVGGGASNVVLLAELNGKEPFKQVLEDRIANREEVTRAQPEKHSATSAMRPKVQDFINATAKKIVRPAIEHLVRPIAKKPVPQAAAPAKAAASATESPVRRVRRPPAAKPAVRAAAKLQAQAKKTSKPIAKPEVKPATKRNSQAAAKPKTSKAAERVAAKPAASKATRKTTRTAAKRAGK